MKKLVSMFFLLSLLISATSVAFAQGGNPPIPEPPNDSAVLDTLDWLSPTQEDEINSVVFALDEEGLGQVAVVTLNDCGADKLKFRNDLFRDWGIGHADDNDGLLIMVCWYNGVKGQRSLEQEVGYGLEGLIPDLLTRQMAEEHLVPVLANGNEETAIESGKAGNALVAIVHAYDEVIRGEPAGSNENETDSSLTGIFWICLILIVIVFVVIVFISIESGGFGGGWSGGGWSNSGSSGGSSGGGFSFGGGSSGGGGSSTGI